MDEFLFESLSRYFNTLGKFGYVNYRKESSLIILDFYYNLLCNDYRGVVKPKDYKLIEKALYCLFGANCLIPYPNIAMGKLQIGGLPEILARLKNIEKTKVIKPESKVVAEVPDLDLDTVEPEHKHCCHVK